MYNYIVIISAMVICVCSIILILKKLTSKDESLSIVPISDIGEIQKYKNAYSQEKNKDVFSDRGILDREDKLEKMEAMNEDSKQELKKELDSAAADKEAFGVLRKELIFEEKGLKDSSYSVNKKEGLIFDAKGQKEIDSMKKELIVEKEIYKKESEYFIRKIKELEKEKMELKEALFEEVSYRDDIPVLDHEREEFDSAKKQIKNAEETTEKLYAANKDLLERIQNQKISIRQMQDDIKKIKSKSYEVQNEDRHRIEELECKLSDVICEKERSEKEYDDIEKLTTYNLTLRMKNITYAKALNEQKSILESYEYNNKTKDLQVKSIISELQIENGNLLAKVKESVASVNNLKDEIRNIRNSTEQEILQLKKDSKNSWDSREETQKIISENVQLKKQLSNLEIKIASLFEEREQLLSDISRNEFNYSKLKEFNAHILEKEKVLKYELTKSRAKSLGLQRLCEDFKVQIEKSGNRTNRLNRVVAG